jgi:hypothetical protein
MKIKNILYCVETSAFLILVFIVFHLQNDEFCLHLRIHGSETTITLHKEHIDTRQVVLEASCKATYILMYVWSEVCISTCCEPSRNYANHWHHLVRQRHMLETQLPCHVTYCFFMYWVPNHNMEIETTHVKSV